MATNFIRLHALEATYFDDILPPSALSRHCSLDNSRHILASNGSIAPDLGTLMRLPAELQLQVILQLDIASFLVWMRVNKSAMEFVWSLVEWRNIARNASALRIAVGLNTHHTFSVLDLLASLKIKECSNCTNSARYIDMSSRHLFRLCHFCFADTKPAKQAVRYAVSKEWERMKKNQNDRFALLWDDFSSSIISKPEYEHKQKKLKASAESEMEQARKRMKAGVSEYRWTRNKERECGSNSSAP